VPRIRPYPAALQTWLIVTLLLVTAPQSPAQTEGGAPDPTPGELAREAEAAGRREAEQRAARERESARARAEREEEQRRIEEEQRRASAEAAAPYEDEIAKQRALQGDLLWEATGRGSPRPEGERFEMAPRHRANGDNLDPRIADAAPRDRKLPSEIFDESRVEIPVGQWGNARVLIVRKLELDADGDRKPELVRYIDRASGEKLRQEEDRNYDGITDAISEYRDGRLSVRVLDSNDDGNPDVWESYAAGLIVLREIDRDDDGVRDVFYRYQGDSLAQERHDANNDGRVDLLIVYENRLRIRTEEDTDRDGRVDTWTLYGPADPVHGAEQIVRIERDRAGRGFADSFEVFENEGGRATLQRREEDLNGDGEIDVISFYEDGRLRRRQITNPDAAPP